MEKTIETTLFDRGMVITFALVVLTIYFAIDRHLWNLVY